MQLGSRVVSVQSGWVRRTWLFSEIRRELAKAESSSARRGRTFSSLGSARGERYVVHVNTSISVGERRRTTALLGCHGVTHTHESTH
eukprot:4189445-Prymnesium_polylepis.2